MFCPIRLVRTTKQLRYELKVQILSISGFATSNVLSNYSGVIKIILVGWTFFILVSAKKSKHCAFIDDIKMKGLSVLFNLLFFFFYFFYYIVCQIYLNCEEQSKQLMLIGHFSYLFSINQLAFFYHFFKHLLKLVSHVQCPTTTDITKLEGIHLCLPLSCSVAVASLYRTKCICYCSEIVC